NALVFSTVRHSFTFNLTVPPDIYTLSLHDALPISARRAARTGQPLGPRLVEPAPRAPRHRGGLPGRLHAGLRGVDECHAFRGARSEEHTSELQSRVDLVCRLLLEKKKRSQN